MTPSKKSALLALGLAMALIWTLPTASSAKGLDLKAAGDALRQVGAAVQQTVSDTETALREAREKTEAALRKTKRDLAERQARLREAERATRATATDPLRQPPSHGTTPHGQGGVAVVDTAPSNERPLGASPSGADSGEDVIVGRARGEQTAAGTYNGHITILSLFGNELAGVNSAQGETKNGPLQPIQTGVLDPLCNTAQVCLSVLTANSTTTASGSDNDFAIARASALGLGVGAAESRGTITTDANCQTSSGSARTANVTAGAGAVAQAANSTSSSRSCRNQAPQTANTSMVIGLGGVQVPLPAAGCADGTPDTVSGVPGLLPVVCNADEIAGASAVREALDVYVLQVGGNSVAKETTAASESLSVAPAGPEASGPACSDGMDNDGDGRVDAADPGCHSDGNPNNPASFVPSDNDETDAPTSGSGGPEDGAPECSDNRDNDGDGLADERDPGCHSDGNPNNPDSYNPDDDDESNGGGRPQCSDNRDNDGDGVTDERDPGCHSDGNPNNPDSYNPNDDSEADGNPSLNEGSLPFTGTDVVGLAFAGLLLLAGGLLLRRREGAHGAW